MKELRESVAARKKGKSRGYEYLDVYTSERGRFHSRRKLEIVLRLLRGEDPGELAVEFGITQDRLMIWEAIFLKAGQAGLRAGRPDLWNIEREWLQSRIRHLVMRLNTERQLSRLRGMGSVSQ